jgi:hypothetical protein
MKKSLFILLAALSTFSEAGLLTYRFEASIDDAFGSSGAGTVLSGEFSFDSDQLGIDTIFTNVKRFEHSGLRLSSISESIEMNIVPGQSDAWIAVGDDSPPLSGEDFMTVSADGNLAFTGTLGGLSVDGMSLVWTDMDGSVNNGFLLPLDDTIFNEYESALFQLRGSDGTVANGVIENVSLVPLPAPVVLLLSGLVSLATVPRRVMMRSGRPG